MRRWLLLLVVPALLVLGLGISPVLAQGGDPQNRSQATPQPTLMQAFYERVASALGRDVESVAKAFQQAQKEAWDARLQERLDRLVSAGRLTQEQADALRAWLAQRPDVSVGPFRPVGQPSLQRVAEILGVDLKALEDAVAQARRAVAEEALSRHLSRLVEQGRISQEQADALLEWFRSRPEGVQDLGGLIGPGKPHLRGHNFGPWGGPGMGGGPGKGTYLR